MVLRLFLVSSHRNIAIILKQIDYESSIPFCLFVGFDLFCAIDVSLLMRY